MRIDSIKNSVNSSEVAVKLHSDAAARNMSPVAKIISAYLVRPGQALEIASGTGQHIAELAMRFPEWNWQPSDIDQNYLDSIYARVKEAARENLGAPIVLDTREKRDLGVRYDLIFSLNMIHISPFASTLGLAEVAGQHLVQGGRLMVYGPFKFKDRELSESNLRFNDYLKELRPDFGIRDYEEIKGVFLNSGLKPDDVISMPANNHFLIFSR